MNKNSWSNGSWLQSRGESFMMEADLFCPNSVRINFTIYQYDKNNWSFIDKSEPIIGKDCSIIEVK